MIISLLKGAGFLEERPIDGGDKLLIDLTQQQLFSMLWSALALGAMLGLLYEFVRLFRFTLCCVNSDCQGLRAIIYHAVTFLGDVILIIIFAITGILQTFKISGGVFRGLTYIGMSLGFLIYYFTVGRLTVGLSKKTAAFLKKATRGIFKILFVPLRLIFLLIFKIYVLTIGKILGKIKCKIKDIKSNDKVVSEGIISVKTEDAEMKGYKKEGRISFGGKGHQK